MRKSGTTTRTCEWFDCSTFISSPVRRYCIQHTQAIAAIKRHLKPLSPVEVHKTKARRLAAEYKRRGLLIQQPCACGGSKSEMHHPDYDQPLLIVWLCRTCHSRQHRATGDRY